MNPEISVVIKTYNRPKLLLRALDSIVKQGNYPSYEIIVVDDGGSASIDEIIKYYSNFGKEVKYIRREKNSDDLGEKADPINDGLRLARGKYICHLDDDDFYRYGRLLLPYLFLEHNPDIALVYCDSIVYRDNIVRRDSSKHFDLARLERGNYIRSCEPMYKREILDKVGKMPSAYVSKTTGACPGDWEYWKMVARAGFKFGHLPIVLCEVIKHTHRDYNKVDWKDTEILKDMVERKLVDQDAPERFIWGDFYD